jgi:hypothetical protein
MPVIATFRDLADAEVASASLEAAGIPNVLADAQTIGVAWHYSNALGGVRLHVPEASASEARAMLYEPMEVEWPELPDGALDEQCPACGRFALGLESGARKTLAVMTAFSMPLWFWRSRLRCGACGSSRRVPHRVRPELVMVWLMTGAAVVIGTAILLTVIGVVIAMISRVLGFTPDGRTR